MIGNNSWLNKPFFNVSDLQRLRVLGHLSDDGKDLVSDALGSALRILLSESERILRHLHQPHRLVDVLLLDHVDDSETCKRSRQSGRKSCLQNTLLIFNLKICKTYYLWDASEQ
jgi:hypothetical protein